MFEIKTRTLLHFNSQDKTKEPIYEIIQKNVSYVLAADKKIDR